MTAATIRECQWDNTQIPRGEDTCPQCGLKPALPKDKSSGADSAPEEEYNSKERRYLPRQSPFSSATTGDIVIGVDPGAKYTGIVVRDGDVVLHASTVVAKSEDALEYAREVVDYVREEVVAQYPQASIGVEGISDPKGYNRGVKAPINPKYVMRMAAVAGAVYTAFRSSVKIDPKGNGKQHISNYPDVLKGRRPVDLAGSSVGAGTRSHEQSAYDVAGKVNAILEEQRDSESVSTK